MVDAWREDQILEVTVDAAFVDEPHQGEQGETPIRYDALCGRI